MIPIRLRLLPAALAVAALLTGGATPGHANNSTGAAVAAGIAGLAVGTMVGAAVASPRDPVIYGPPPPPPPPGYRPPPPPPYYPPPPGYRPPPPMGAPFSPAPNVMCYPARRACFNMSLGGFSANWTHRVFGY